MTFNDIVCSQLFPELPICIERDVLSVDHPDYKHIICMNVQKRKRPAENIQSIELNVVNN